MNDQLVNFNKLFNEHFSNELSGLVPIRFTDPDNTAVTILDSKTDAFNLKPIKHTIWEYGSLSSNNNPAVFRTMLGPYTIKECLENENLFVFTMCNIINDGLRQLTRELGDLRGRKIYCNRYGDIDGPFRYSDTSEISLEFRIVVEGKKDDA